VDPPQHVWASAAALLLCVGMDVRGGQQCRWLYGQQIVV
jgi:hypothetical protein